MAHHSVVQRLETLLQTDVRIRRGLAEAVRAANLPDIESIDGYIAYLDALVESIPSPDTLYPQIVKFYWILKQEPARRIRAESGVFRRWIASFIEAWGTFLDTPESAKHIQAFLDDPEFRIEEYDPGPSGWMTFNQFFALAIRPGMRPVAGRFDDRVIVAPADSLYKTQVPIGDDATIVSKGVTYPIPSLLADSAYARAFEGGTFMHAFLHVNDYHRYHVPVRGEVKDVRHILGEVNLDVYQDAAGNLEAHAGVGHQFQQARGLIIQDSPVGLVATLPIGMGQVSSVNVTPRVGSYLDKGEEFGYFLFGGSDIVILFQRGAADLTVERDTHRKVGERIGTGVVR